jgi:hypothetical protein
MNTYRLSIQNQNAAQETITRFCENLEARLRRMEGPGLGPYRYTIEEVVNALHNVANDYAMGPGLYPEEG